MRKINLQFTEQEINIILEALSQLPWRTVNQLMCNVRDQIKTNKTPAKEKETKKGK